jgi:hypothetical protein
MWFMRLMKLAGGWCSGEAKVKAESWEVKEQLKNHGTYVLGEEVVFLVVTKVFAGGPQQTSVSIMHSYKSRSPGGRIR